MSNVILGGAIADSLGMPFESKPADNFLLLSWDGKSYLGSESHKLNPGQWTDDTQFSCQLAKSLIENDGFNPDDLAKRYVELFTSKTIRGYGLTTKAAIDNLISGVHWSNSGVFGSYGNGTAMRVSPIGIYFRNDLTQLIEAATIDAKITHNSDEAVAGSIAIAMTAALACNNDTDNLLERLCEIIPDSKVKVVIHSLSAIINSPHINAAQALKIIGTRADVRETVPAALFCFLKFNNYHEAVECIIRAGFDTDTGGSITAALISAKYGIKCIPKYMVETIEDSEKLIILDSQLYNRSNKSFFN